MHRTEGGEQAGPQVQFENAIDVGLSNHPGEARTPCPVIWENDIELSRIAAAYCLHDLAEAEAREAIALDYQLVTSETNLILVHERAESEKAEDLPELHQVRPMLAAGYGGNGTVTQKHVKAPLRIMRSVSDSAPFIADSRNMSLCMSIERSAPAVWRTARTHTAARVNSMAATGMDDIEIPAFLRKQADGNDTTTKQQPEKERTASLQKETSKTPQASSDDLTAILRLAQDQHNPVIELLNGFNQAALNHVQFRSALAACLRMNSAGYLQWLVTKHMKAAGSAAAIWAVFISWAAEYFSVPLDRHAERLLRDFLKTILPKTLEAVLADLHALEENPPKRNLKC